MNRFIEGICWYIEHNWGGWLYIILSHVIIYFFGLTAIYISMCPLGFLIISALLHDMVSNTGHDGLGLIVIMLMMTIPALIASFIGFNVILFILAIVGAFIFMVIECGMIFDIRDSVKKFKEKKEYEENEIIRRLKHGVR